MKIWICIFVFFLSTGCERSEQTAPSEGVTSLSVWAHAGQGAERQVLTSQVNRFNERHDKIRIALTFIPERDYNAQVQAAALAGDLPDILEFDGPYLYNYIWQQHLQPLEGLLPQSVIDDLIPSVLDQGTHGHHVYSIAVFDSGLGLYARRSALDQIGARIPAGHDDAWSIDEFNHVLARLAQVNGDRAVLDLKLNYSGEWFTYGFSPVLQSAGADLIEREQYQTSTGILNAPQAVAALEHIQKWIASGLVDPNLDDSAFIAGRVPLSWVGHWEYGRYKQTWQEDLVVLPLPDFGHGSRTGQGSWNWGISARSRHPQAAAQFLVFLLQTEQVLAMCAANGAVPGTRSAVQRSERYGTQGELRLFATQLIQGVAVARPKTPAYPVITNAFQRVFQQMRDGADIKKALDNAAGRIDEDIRDNHGYPFVSQ